VLVLGPTPSFAPFSRRDLCGDHELINRDPGARCLVEVLLAEHGGCEGRYQAPREQLRLSSGQGFVAELRSLTRRTLVFQLSSRWTADAPSGGRLGHPSPLSVMVR